MHIEKVYVTLFDKGDYVQTSSGVGIVISTDEKWFGDNSWNGQIITVQHKEGWSGNPSNDPIDPIDMEARYALSIDKNEYKNW